MLRFILWSSIWLFCIISILGQPKCQITHYSSVDGLSQNTVMSMAQGKDGQMWFGTWDGINRFNGYSFQVFKANTTDNSTLINDRVDILRMDSCDFLWMLAYDNMVYRFDSRTEQFQRVPQGNGDRAYRDIQVLPNGSVWLLSSTGPNVRVQTNKQNFSLKTTDYPGFINKIMADIHGNEWLLTLNGLAQINHTTQKATYFFHRTKPRSVDLLHGFYACLSTSDALYFGSDEGAVYKYSYQTQRFTRFKLSVKGRIIAINLMKNGTILFTTDRQGAELWNPHNGNYHVFDQLASGKNGTDEVCSTFMDSHGSVWFEMKDMGEVCRLDPLTGSFQRMKQWVDLRGADRSYPPFQICEDSHHNLWVHPRGGGLSWYDRRQDKLIPFRGNNGNCGRPFSGELHSMYADRQGNLWLCTHSSGLEKISFPTQHFHFYPEETSENPDDNDNYVRALFEDNQGRLWMGRRNGKITIYKPDFQTIGLLTEKGNISPHETPFSGVAYDILQDRRGNIWIGTKGKGVFLLEKQLDGHFRTVHFTHRTNDPSSLSHNNVYGLLEDRYGRIWVATFGGGLNYILYSGNGNYRIVHFKNGLTHYPFTQCYRTRNLQSDGKGNLWVATSSGVLCFRDDFKRPQDVSFHLYSRLSPQTEGLSSNNIYRVLTASDGTVYLITFGGGLNRFTGFSKEGKATFKSYTVKDGLPSNILLSAVEDNQKNLWIATENGLSKFTPSIHRFENYGEKDFLRPVRFEEATALRLHDGQLMFGTDNGVLYFHPESIRKNRFTPSIVFDNLKIQNKIIHPDKENSPLTTALNYADKLTFTHQDNIITLTYAAVDMNGSENIQYAYRLDGFDKTWNYVGSQRTATYTNLPEGEYTFRVKSTNSDGVWVHNERKLTLIMQPSFWETPWAYFLYTLFTLLIIATATWILFTFYRLRHHVKVEQEVADLKLRFFTNISHELRTPLTLITGPVETLLQEKQLPKEVEKSLQGVKRNTDRMTRLVNQILDFRRLEKHKMKLLVEQIDLVSFLQKEMDYFRPLAEEHKLSFSFDCSLEKAPVWADADKLEKIVFNLLSNAFKYTPSGKTITVFLRENPDSFLFGVKDEGTGISEAMKKVLFVRFETQMGQNTLFKSQSSGIGLSVVKELIDLHHATIKVDSKEGEGSCFTIEMKKGHAHFKDTDAEFILNDSVSTTSHHQEATNEKEDGQILLIVEDNAELREFVAGIFRKEYKIIEAADGEEGYKKATESLPDLIISDVMMPKKDGMEMVKELHNTSATSHIPVILLTAKTDMDSQVEGLRLGADAYITKPFSATYLKARVTNILKKRAELQKRYCAELLDKPAEKEETSLTLSDYDRQFMTRLTDYIEKNIDNGDLVIEELAREVAVSRSVFFRKLKGLTGMAPVEFIKQIRIKRAAKLIASGEYAISQVAYKVGFNDSRYFSKCFKAHYGMTPSEYKEKIHDNKMSRQE